MNISFVFIILTNYRGNKEFCVKLVSVVKSKTCNTLVSVKRVRTFSLKNNKFKRDYQCIFPYFSFTLHE